MAGTAQTRGDDNEALIDSGYAWIRLGVSMLLATIGCVGMWSIVVVLPAVQVEFGVDRADASLPYTFLMFGFAAGNMFIGRLVDRMGIAVPMAIAAVALGAGFILAAHKHPAAPENQRPQQQDFPHQKQPPFSL